MTDNDPISLQGTQFADLDYFIVQASFAPDGMEITFMEEQFTSEDAAVVTTVGAQLNDDPALNEVMRVVQENLNIAVVRAYQIIRDSKA